MPTEKQRMREIEKAKTAKRKEANQVRLTIETAEIRKEWQDRWAELRAYAGKVSFTYCARRLRQYSLDQIREVRDEALSEAWRYVCNGERAERAITMSVDSITKTRVNHVNQSQPLPDLACHSPEYQEGEDNVREIVRLLPEKTRPVAICLSAGIESSYEIADIVGLSEPTVRRYRERIAKALGSRFGWLLLAQWEVPIDARISNLN